MRSTVRQLEARLHQASSAVECLAALLELAHLHATEYRHREGLRAAREALNIARARQDAVAAARALTVASTCHYHRGDYLSAVASGLDAVESCDDAAARSSAQQAMALALHAVQAHEAAVRMAGRALADARACADTSCEAGARAVLGSIALGRGAFKAARRDLRIAASRYRLADDGVRQKKAIAQIGDSYREQGNREHAAQRQPQAHFSWHRALRVYDVAMATGKSAGDDALVLARRAECHCGLGDLAQAGADAACAVDIAHEVGSPIVLAPCLLWQGHVLRGMGEVEAAERACERAREAAARLEHSDLLVSCLHALATLADQRGRFERAQDFEKAAHQLSLERSAALARAREQLAELSEKHAHAKAAGQRRTPGLLNSHA